MRKAVAAAAAVVLAALCIMVGYFVGSRQAESGFAVAAYDHKAVVTEAVSAKLGKININTASAEQLETLDGIGSKLSARIIEYREKNGLFAYTSDIMNVAGIGEVKYEAIRDRISVN